MANVGPIISLASIAAVRDEIEYLEDEMDLDHAGYTLTSIKTFGNTTIADFPNQCAELNKRYNEWNPLTRGNRTEVIAHWLMPRFADGVRLQPQEQQLIENICKKVLGPHSFGLNNWHVPPSTTTGRQKGPDYNIIVASTCNVSGIPVRLRHHDHSLWGFLRDGLNYGVAVLNLDRKKQGLPLIPSVTEVRQKQRQAKGTLYLCEQIALLPEPPKEISQLRPSLDLLGFDAIPTGNKDHVKIRRRVEPLVQTKASSNPGGFVLSLNLLMHEVRLALALKRRRAEEKQMAHTQQPPTVSPAWTHPHPTVTDDTQSKKPASASAKALDKHKLQKPETGPDKATQNQTMIR